MINEQVDKTSQLIHATYDRDRAKPEYRAVFDMIYAGRKYGFPVVSGLNQGEMDDAAFYIYQLQQASRLLLFVINVWPSCDIPDGFKPSYGSKLYSDANRLIANATGARDQFLQVMVE